MPTATDIAFAVGVLALLGKRVDPALRALLLALAIADDVAAIVIIAVVFAGGVSVIGLAIAATGVAGVLLLRKLGVTTEILYALPGAVLWIGLLDAGVHPVLAGVALGLLTPMTPRHAGEPPPAVRIERLLHPWVAFLVMPLFALANAGIRLGGIDLAEPASRSLVGAITLGLVVGKPLGIVATGVARRTARLVRAAAAGALERRARGRLPRRNRFHYGYLRRDARVSERRCARGGEARSAYRVGRGRRARPSARRVAIEETVMNASTEARLLLCIAGLMLLEATIGGAVASHVLTNLDERSLRSFDTAVDFEFFHALGLIGIVLVADRIGATLWLRAAAWLIVAGVVLFCGSIYFVTFGAPRAVLSVAPYGGVALMAAWLAFAIGVWRRPA